MLKELAEICYNIESAKDKILEADPNGNVTIHEGTEILFCNVSHVMKKIKKGKHCSNYSLVTFFFFNKIKHLNSLFLMFYIIVN